MIAIVNEPSDAQRQVWRVASDRIGLFLRDGNGRRPVFGGYAKFQYDPHFRDLILFMSISTGTLGEARVRAPDRLDRARRKPDRLMGDEGAGQVIHWDDLGTGRVSDRRGGLSCH